MSDILPCPFCGASASIEECDGGSYGVRFSVGCDSETEADCMGYQSFTTFFNTRKEAVVAWNKRTDATLRAELAEVTEELEAWTKRGPISGDEVILIAEARDQARRELAAERELRLKTEAHRMVERAALKKFDDRGCFCAKGKSTVGANALCFLCEALSQPAPDVGAVIQRFVSTMNRIMMVKPFIPVIERIQADVKLTLAATEADRKRMNL